jgi:hypothetical protein
LYCFISQQGSESNKYTAKPVMSNEKGDDWSVSWWYHL